MKAWYACDETRNQIFYSRNVVYLSQKKRDKFVLLMNFTRIYSTLVLLDRLSVLITIRSYSLVVSQDLLNLISKYKILLQKKKIRSNNIITLLRILCFLSKINVSKIMLLRVNLSHKS